MNSVAPFTLHVEPRSHGFVILDPRVYGNRGPAEVAFVQAEPCRQWHVAKAMADRIARSRLYLAFSLYFDLPGVFDLREVHP